MPVRFPLAAGWLAKPVKSDGGPADGLFRQGDATLTCEIDAKPAGLIGFLRVWVAKPGAGGARPALTAFLGADRDLSEVAYRDLKTGGMSAVEATYVRKSVTEAGGKRERVLAVDAPQGVAMLVLSGLDNDQYQRMLPAYGLMRSDIAPAH